MRPSQARNELYHNPTPMTKPKMKIIYRPTPSRPCLQRVKKKWVLRDADVDYERVMTDAEVNHLIADWHKGEETRLRVRGIEPG